MKIINYWFIGLLSTTVHAEPEVHYNECKPSFNYLGADYQGTTNKNNTGSQWCYLKKPIDGASWGNVRVETIPKFTTISGTSCRSPSSYMGEQFYGCSSRNHTTPWCYTDERNWEECERTPPAQLLSHTHPQQSKRLDRIALGSCFKTQGDMPDALARLIGHKPDLYLWLGDNIYADTTDMSKMRQKYDDKKLNSDYQQFLAAKIPTMATWDDHDFGLNNEGKHYPKRAQSQAAYLRHFDVPADDPRHTTQAGIYEAKMLGQPGEQTHVITLDARYFRSPTFSSYGECEGSSSTILGMAQWQWLENELAKPSQIKLIASGIQVLPPLYQGRPKSKYCTYAEGTTFDNAISSLGETNMSGTSYESWAEMPAQRERLLRLVQKSINSGKTKAVIFLSGDQHWGELLQKNIPASHEHGKATTVYEITASGFGQSWPYHIENPLRLPIYADAKGDNNYTQQCQFPAKHAGKTYRGCTSEGREKPWCYTQLDNDGNGTNQHWGFCATTGDTIPTGRVGTVSQNVNQMTTSDHHLINKSGSNYGMLDIDWQNREIKLSIQTATEEAVSTIVRF
ncbi:alkaline phosphatase D family protein [Pseudoalteromonas sp. MMG012]|uniref:alkaline phosphatase D family protein n=1 Tax=Pseudoalteromonas sp. MMG012 TaxID=2822686 RepID=UPI001B3A22A1|nr:alkaline phosphatase D family protein [Pseudoalteromonas sp. MMG012]MBQ4852931.1 alkaline phosphatase D family protein [Pseudoalteromonas sp. MMG012]